MAMQDKFQALLSVLIPLGLAHLLLPVPAVLAVAVLLCFSSSGKLDLTGLSNLMGTSGITTCRSDPTPAISIPALISSGDVGGKATQQNLQAREDLQTLRDEFKFCAKFAMQVKQLEDLGYRGWRRVRGDGNCFYRAFYFGVLEQLGELPKCLQQWAATLEAKLRLMSYEDTAQQSAHQRLIDLFAGLAAGRGWQDRSVQGWEKMRQEDLVFASFMDQSFASLDWAMIAALRRLTAGCFLEKADDMEFGNGLSLRELLSAQGLGSPREFCDNVILVMGKEAETVVMNAVVAVVEVNMELVILDARHPDLSVQQYAVPDASMECPTVHLQLRPGHYDLIYQDAHGTAPMAEEATPLKPRSSDKEPVLSASQDHPNLNAGSHTCPSCHLTVCPHVVARVTTLAKQVKELEDKLKEKELECSSLRKDLQAGKLATQKDDLASEKEVLRLTLEDMAAQKKGVDHRLEMVIAERDQYKQQLNEHQLQRVVPQQGGHTTQQHVTNTHQPRWQPQVRRQPEQHAPQPGRFDRMIRRWK